MNHKQCIWHTGSHFHYFCCGPNEDPNMDVKEEDPARKIIVQDVNDSRYLHFNVDFIYTKNKRRSFCICEVSMGSFKIVTEKGNNEYNARSHAITKLMVFLREMFGNKPFKLV